MSDHTSPPFWSRFWAKVRKTESCWLWVGATNTWGYGNFWGADGKCWRAHRWAYVALVGPVPEGLELDHLCRVRNCVNPAHLEPVTKDENYRRGIGPIHAKYQHLDQTECKHGHPLSGDNLYVQPKTGYRYCRTCQKRRRAEWRARQHILKPIVKELS